MKAHPTAPGSARSLQDDRPARPAGGHQDQSRLAHLRGTGTAAYLINSGTLDAAQRMAGHADPPTTKLYNRPGDQVTLDDVEWISF